jgi:hypothetical protein
VAEVGIYNVALPIAAISNIFISPLNALIMPMVSEHMEGEKEAKKGNYSYSYSSWSDKCYNWRDYVKDQDDYIDGLDINKFHALRIRLEQCGLKATHSHDTTGMSSNRGCFSLTISWY